MTIEAMKQVLMFLEHLTTHSWTLKDQNKAIELLRQAIEQAEQGPKLGQGISDNPYVNDPDCNEPNSRCAKWTNKLLELEQAQKQEPVARVVSHGATVKLEWASVEAAHNAKAGPLFSISPQRQPLTEWQPIETAPDETEVFIGAFIDGVFKFGRSVRFYEQGNEFEGETWSGWVWSIDDCSDSVAEMPTHWMPLPSAPIEAAHGIKGEA